MKKQTILNSLLFVLGLTLGFSFGEFRIHPEAAPMEHKEVNEVSYKEHMHDMLEVESKKIPKVTLEAEKDLKDGLNIKLTTENFAFTPEKVNSDPVQNEGHAHVFVNGVKVARVYGKYFHIPGSILIPGENTITVTLNANNHSEWAVAGAHVEAEVKVFN